MQIDGQALHLLLFWLGGLSAVVLGAYFRRKRGFRFSGYRLIDDFSNGVVLVLLAWLFPSALIASFLNQNLVLTFNGTDAVVLTFIVVRAIYWLLQRIGS